MPTPPGPMSGIMKFESRMLQLLCPEISHFEWHPGTHIVYAVKGKMGHELGEARDSNEAKNLICAFRLGYKLAKEQKLILTPGDQNAGAGTTRLPEPR